MATNVLKIPNSCTYYQLIYTKSGWLISFSNEVVSFYQELEENNLNKTLMFLKDKTKLKRYIPIFNNLPNIDEYHAIYNL